ncbi:MAG TPA: ScpA family protein [Aestuariivirgaceae bacterium]|nr:ScpA family protein [Aestuariivirgaceae bacterium]
MSNTNDTMGGGASAPTEIWPDGESPVRRDLSLEQGEAFLVDLESFEGPLDLLLELARHHKIDLARISILALAEQYLSFISNVRQLRLEVAADYLVMAAWLAYLKSRLLLPAAPGNDEPVAEDLAARLAFRLQRLQAMREAATQLLGRNRLGRDVFERGTPEPLVFATQRQYSDNLFDLLKAYAERRQRLVSHRTYHIKKLPVWSINQAREVLTRLIGVMDDWGRFDVYLHDYLVDPRQRRKVTASSFSASLELAREGTLEIRQDEAFKPLYMRRRRSAAAG